MRLAAHHGWSAAGVGRRQQKRNGALSSNGAQDGEFSRVHLSAHPGHAADSRASAVIVDATAAPFLFRRKPSRFLAYWPEARLATRRIHLSRFVAVS